MKHILISLAALSLLAACNKNNPGEQQLPNAEEETVLVTFMLEDPGLSRSTSSAKESTIERAQVAVYDADGFMLAVGKSISGTVSLRVPMGASGCSAFALVNSTVDLAVYPSKSTVLHLMSTLGANRAANLTGLEMAGSLSNITFTEDYQGEIFLNHFAAKVQIDEIANAIPGNPVLTVNGIYLINVNTQLRYDFDDSALLWAQKRAYTESETTIIPYTAEISAVNINGESSHQVTHYFYCYPNPTTSDSSSETWGPRYTRLVVDATYSGHRYYYPINIKGNDGRLNYNTHYLITKLTITGPGSDSPDKPVNKGGASFSLQVIDWENGISQEVVI